ncbi:BtrH N-terminal domain-containing protein [Nonomuraea sp. NPDC001023]|uniref:BtrH N-terminal domain-containing protein n=1 Tax=unclassified Nonomuraea TaxID=2593643 RepID=UPI0033341A1B
MLIDLVPPFEGRHCETTTAGTLLRHAGVELSEAMLFGLGEGLSFIYWDSGSLDVPLIGGRVKPHALTEKLAAALGFTLDTQETSSPITAWSNVRRHLDEGAPVGIRLDCYHLDYVRTPYHFGGHYVAMIGYDEGHAHLVDTAQHGTRNRVPLDSLERARAATGPMTAHNLSYTLGPCAEPDLPQAVRTAVRSTAAAFLNPAMRNVGYRGIEQAAALIPTWLERGPTAQLTRTANLMERGGTGGAFFRNLYTEFLAEAQMIAPGKALETACQAYMALAPKWSEVADLLAQAGETGRQQPLDQAGALLYDLAVRERLAMETLYEAA